MSKQERPKKSVGDVAHAIAKAGISAIPIAGAPAAEIFALVVTPPYERRRDEWVESIGNGLKELAEKVEGFQIEELSNNETFITTITHASQIAVKHHQKEKLESLRNAVLNAALPNAPEEDVQLMFLNYVDTFTLWQLMILNCLANPLSWVSKTGVTFNKDEPLYVSQLIEGAFPQLRSRTRLYQLWVDDLYSKGLIDIHTRSTDLYRNELLSPHATELGKVFLDFISNPIA